MNRSKTNSKPNFVIPDTRNRAKDHIIIYYYARIWSLFPKGVAGNLSNDIFDYMVALINKKPENVRIADAVRDTRVVLNEAYEFALAFEYIRVCINLTFRTFRAKTL